MTRTLLATALLALMVPTMGRADDADAEKQVAMLSKKHREADVKGDTKAHGLHPGRRLGGHQPQWRYRSKAQAKI